MIDAALQPPFNAWVHHLFSLLVPLLTLSFMLTAPHTGVLTLLWFAPLIVLDQMDRRAGPEVRQPDPTMPKWPFDLIVALNVVIHFTVLYLLVCLFSQQSLLSWDGLMAFVLVGINSSFSGIVVAHELIHRRSKFLQTVGRLILCTVMYEHFYTEHIRGHHVRVGTDADPATARFGESFWAFYRRTVPGQFRSAWQLDRSRVLQGLIAEWALAFLVLGVFGWASFAIYLAQAWRASFLLEMVNYFEHWGLKRSGRGVRTVDSWDTDSWVTLYSLVGLSRHADHHASAARPYQQLRHRAESPRLPVGYLSLMARVLFENKRFIREATAELQRLKLGPFEEPAPQ